jgi:hypothetical protein
MPLPELDDLVRIGKLKVSRRVCALLATLPES